MDSEIKTQHVNTHDVKVNLREVPVLEQAYYILNLTAPVMSVRG
jgi:hypothetical protein